MNPKPSHTSLSSRTLAPVGLAALCVALLGGCVNSQREAYFQAHAAVVQPHTGSGSARLALWPATPWGRSTLAAVDHQSDEVPLLPRPARGDATR